MTTNFPSSIDNFTNPTSSSTMASPSHSAQHADVNDAVEALQAKVGVDGSAVTSSLDYKVAQQGLTFIKSQAIGSGVSSVTMTNAFDGTFDDYRVIVSGTYASTAGGQTLRMRFGSGNSTEYWGGGQAVLYSGTVNTWSFYNAAQLDLAYLDTQPSRLSVAFDVITPYLTTSATSVHSNGTGLLSGVWVNGMYAPVERVTDLYFFTSSGTITGGTIRVYGYNNG